MKAPTRVTLALAIAIATTAAVLPASAQAHMGSTAGISIWKHTATYSLKYNDCFNHSMTGHSYRVPYGGKYYYCSSVKKYL